MSKEQLSQLIEDNNKFFEAINNGTIKTTIEYVNSKIEFLNSEIDKYDNNENNVKQHLIESCYKFYRFRDRG
jgi:hypothetical protein